MNASCAGREEKETRREVRNTPAVTVPCRAKHEASKEKGMHGQ